MDEEDHQLLGKLEQRQKIAQSNLDLVEQMYGKGSVQWETANQQVDNVIREILTFSNLRKFQEDNR